MNTLLRRTEVQRITSIKSSSQLYALMNRGEFPKPIRLSAHTVAWVQSEVEDWIAERIQRRDQAGQAGNETARMSQ